MFLPFSDQAKQWEPPALALRRLLGVGITQLLDPWQLAPKVGLRVIDGRVALQNVSEEDQAHLQGDANHHWSGGVYPVALPDGTRICILNPNHSYRRRKITLMEEIVHTHLSHVPSKVLVHGNGLHFRDYDAEQEKEAYGIGAAALLPWSTFFCALNAGQNAKDLAEEYDVTTHLIEYRIKITGAYRLYRSRRR